MRPGAGIFEEHHLRFNRLSQKAEAVKNKILAILVAAFLAVGAAYGAQWYGRGKFESTKDAVFEELLMLTNTQQIMYSAADLEKVPPVVRAYLQKAMPESGVRTRTVRLSLGGDTKMTKESSWDSFRASQLITCDPVQMAWASSTEYGPLMPVNTLTLLSQGSGSVESYLWGLVEMYTNSGYAMHEYLMLRWLGEAVWHPDSLLPGPNLSWQETPSPTPSTKAAKVTLQDGHFKVSGRFVFTSMGGPPMMFLADSLSQGQFAGQNWYCQYSDWGRQGNLQIPFSMTQGVRQGIGDDQRLRFKVEKVEYQ